MKVKKILSNVLSVTKAVAPAVGTKKLYDSMFNHRFETNKLLAFSENDFPNLIKEERYEFLSGKNMLVGYIYRQKNKKGRGLFVFAHGFGGGGHHCYLDLINSICANGFLVFAYDATANDESEGKGIGGFTQGLLDAHNAISFIENLDKYSKLPLYLCGHSWGAYSVSCALGWHPNVKGLIALSGFNNATSIFKANNDKYVGEKGIDFIRCVDSYEEILFGKVCQRTAIESFRDAKDTRIAIVHSFDDKIVPISVGLDLYKKEFENEKRFLFVRLLNKGHGTVYYTTNGKQYYEKIEDAYNRINQREKMDDKEKAEFMLSRIDRKKYNSMVDDKLIERLIKFVSK